MPNRSKQKGDRAEREIVELLRAAGLEAYRIPLSGAVSGFKSDVEVRLSGQTLKLESKCRSKGFRNVYRWLDGSDGLVIKADRERALLVIDLECFAKVLSLIARNQTEKATDKPALEPLAQPLEQEPQPLTISIDANSAPIQSDKVYLNRPRLEPLGIAPVTDYKR